MARASISSCTAMPRALLNRSIPLYKSQNHQRRSTPSSTNLILVESFNNTVLVSPIVLEEDFCLKEHVCLTFPPEVNNSITRKAIGRFQGNIENAIKYMDHVYY